MCFHKGDPLSLLMLWENSSKGILMVEKIISSVVFIVWGEGRGERGGSVGAGGRGGGNYAQLSGKYTANAALLLCTIHHCAAASKV